MRLVILETPTDVAEWAAKYVVKKIIDFNPGPDRYFALGLPAGSTYSEMYQKLVEYHKAGHVSFKYITMFNLNEYRNLPKDHPESYHHYMWNNLFRHIDIDPKNANTLDGNAVDLETECKEYEKKIMEAGGVDLFIGEIGTNGQIAFNEPYSSIMSRTRIKTLAQYTLEANARFFGNDSTKVPKQALTVGVGTVKDATEVMILAAGSQKALALKRTIEEGVNHMWTFSAFQQHPNTLVICDNDAALGLSVKTVKYFENLSSLHN